MGKPNGVRITAQALGIVIGCAAFVSGVVRASGTEHSSPIPPSADAAPATPAVETKSPGLFSSIQQKVDELRRADEDNARLRLENAHLRLKLEATQFECDARLSQAQTTKLGSALHDETGSMIGRTLASIQYQIPEHLTPEQLVALGTSYFKARDDEKAAAVLTFLSRLESAPSVVTPSLKLMTAVAWYRLEHFELSRAYLRELLEAKEARDILPYQAQARLWMGLVNSRTGRHDDSQRWLKELVDYHPQSTEAGWVNASSGSREVGRVPASH